MFFLDTMASILIYSMTTLVVAATLLLVYIRWSFSYWKKRGIPYLEPSFPFGNFENPLTNEKPQSTSFREFYEKFKKMGAGYGGVYSYWLPVFVPIDPEYNKYILVKNFSHFQDRGFYNNEKHQPVSANLFTHDGDNWKTLRVKFTPTFTSAKMKMMFSLAVNATKAMEKHCEDLAIRKLPLKVNGCAIRFTTDVIGSSAFGIECNSFEDISFHTKLKRCLTKATNFITTTLCIALPKLAQFLRIPLFPPDDTEFLCKSIDETIRYRKENNITRNDFLQIVLELMDNNVVNMNEVRAQCLLFFIAGYETSSTTMTFFLYEMASNPNIQEKLRNEIKEILDKNGGEITYEAVRNMHYLEMVLCETLRKYPPLPFLHRKCVQDFAIPNTNSVIEKDTLIVVPAIAMHYDPEYFLNPEKFDPERFTEENKAKIVPYTYLPFGDGPRNCIGERFGKQQVKVGMIALLRRFRFRINSEMEFPVQLATNFIMTPKKEVLLDVEIISK